MIRSRVFEGPAQIGEALARRITDGMRQAAERGRSYVLGCPGGRTFRPIYSALGALLSKESLSSSHLVIVMMDEYVTAPTADGPITTVDPDAHYSCRRFGRLEILDVLNADLAPNHRVPDNALWLPDPSRPEAYDETIASAGGIDLFLLASGSSDGHVAFCGPGSSDKAKTSIVELAETTRTDNLLTFPSFASIDEVPTHGVTVGLGTISNLSKSVVLVAHGHGKQETVRRVGLSERFDPEWPATIVHNCHNADFFVDRKAADQSGAAATSGIDSQ